MNNDTAIMVKRLQRILAEHGFRGAYIGGYFFAIDAHSQHHWGVETWESLPPSSQGVARVARIAGEESANYTAKIDENETAPGHMNQEP